jgi:hypothetical protein
MPEIRVERLERWRVTAEDFERQVRLAAQAQWPPTSVRPHLLTLMTWQGHQRPSMGPHLLTLHGTPL